MTRLAALALAIGSVAVPVAADGCGTPQAPPAPSLSDPIVVDAARAGGEPSIQPLPDGTLLYAAHAGTTHQRTRSQPDPDFVVPYTNTDYLWRSEDGGSRWDYVGLAGTGIGPHALTGFSDPATAVDAAGTAYIAGITLANTYVAWSDDQGRTWSGNPVSATLTDREWLAADRDGEVFLSGNHLTRGRMLWRSSDRGRTWGEGIALPGTGAPSPMVVDPTDGRLYVPTPNQQQFAFSPGRVTVFPGLRDGDTSSFTRTVPDGLPHAHGFFNPIAIDDAGGVYVVANTIEDIIVAHSADRGLTWTSSVVRASDSTVLWPWISAGASGRVAVSWLETDEPVVSVSTQPAAYRVGVSTTVTATGWTDACGQPQPPAWSPAAFTQPIHVGTVCSEGLMCQLLGDSDRRLGDYHTNAVTPDGEVLVATGATALRPDSPISRPVLIRAGGVDLRP